MSDTSVEIVRAGFEAWNEGGIEALLEYIHPQFEVTTPPDLAAEPDTYRGHDGVRRYFESFYDAMDRVSFEPHDYLPVGDLVVMPMTLRARGRATGIETEQSVVQVWEVKDGKVIRAEVFATLDEAMAAAQARLGAEAGEPAA